MSDRIPKCYIVINPQHLKNLWADAVYVPLREALNTARFECINLSEEELLKCYDEINPDDLILFAGSFLLNLNTTEAEKIFNCMSGIKVSMCFDDEYLYRRSIKQSKYVHHHITFDTVTYEYLCQLGVPCSLCPLPLSPIQKLSQKKSNEVYDVSFIGRVNSDKPLRYDLLTKIQTKYPNSFIPGINGQFIPFDQMYDTFYKSRINLNLTAISDFSLDHILPYQHYRHGFKARPFEIGMCGGFCLTEFSRSTKVMTKGMDFLPHFENADDCIRQIDQYLEDKASRKKNAGNLNLFCLKYISSDSLDNLFANTVKSIYQRETESDKNIQRVPRSYLHDDRSALIPSMEHERLVNLLKNKNYVRLVKQFSFLFKTSRLFASIAFLRLSFLGASWLFRKFFRRGNI